MTARISISFFIFFNAMISSCGQDVKNRPQHSNEHYSFNTDSLLAHVKILSSDAFEGRRTGTRGAEKSREYIRKRFRNFNIQPFGKDFEQSFSFNRREKQYDAVNLIGYIEGSGHPDKYIVLSAHYDHEGIKNNEIYNGADDDASGVSALFAFAEYFKTHPPRHSVILAAFDAEELGLQGSRYFVDNPTVPLEKIILNINMDMIGRSDNNELYATGTVYNDSLKSLISDFETVDGITLLMGHDGQDGLQDWTYSSDHGPFHLKNIPFLYFGEEDHEDYHRPTDDYGKIQLEFFKTAVHTIINIFSLVDGMNF